MGLRSPPDAVKERTRQVHHWLRPGPDRSLTHFAAHPDELEQRLRELKDEWDVERIIEADHLIPALLDMMVGYLRSRRWFLLPLAMPELVVQYASLGHCPAIPLLGRLAYRTRREVSHERRALETLRCTTRIARPVTLLAIEIKAPLHRSPLLAKISA